MKNMKECKKKLLVKVLIVVYLKSKNQSDRSWPNDMDVHIGKHS